MSDIIKLITVTVVGIDDDGSVYTGCASSYQGEDEELDEAIDGVKTSAYEVYNDDNGPLNNRCIVNVTDVPHPKHSHTLITATLPEGENGAVHTVTATLA